MPLPKKLNFMPVYRFRVTIEEHEDLVRDIEIKPSQTLEDLHQSILGSIKFPNVEAPVFATCNDHWRKEEEFEARDFGKKKMGLLVDDPHKKLLLEFDTDRPWTLYVELFRIVQDENGASYPRIVKEVAPSPSPFKVQPIDPDLLEEDEDEISSTEKAERATIFSESHDFVEDAINEEETPEGEEGDEEDMEFPDEESDSYDQGEEY